MQRYAVVACLLLGPIQAAAQGPVVPIPDASGPFGALGAPTLVTVAGDVIHVGSYAHPSSGGNALSYARSADVGRTWDAATTLFPADPSQTFTYELLASPTHVHALQGSVSGVRCRSSNDAGRTWSPIVQVPSMVPGGTIPSFLVASSDAATLVVLSGTPYAGLLAFSRSLDGGATWLAPFVLLEGDILLARLDLAGSRIHVATDDFNATGIYHQVSHDSGLTWSPRVAIAPPRTPNLYDWRWSFHAAGNDVLVVYPLGGSIWRNRSTDGGRSWPSPPLSFAAGSSLSHVHDAGTDYLATNSQSGPITLHHSLDHGASWTPHATPLRGDPTLAADGGAVALVAKDTANATTSISISAAISTNRGQSWSSTGTISAPFGNPSPYYSSSWHRLGAHFRRPALVLHEEHVQCANFGASCSWTGMQLLVSPNAGRTWFSAPLPSSTYPPGSIELAAVRDSLYLIVGNENLRFPTSSPRPLYGTLLYGAQPYGSPTAGSGGFAPELRAIGEPLVGRSMTLALERTLGGAPAFLGVSLVGEARIPLGAGTLWIQPPLTSIGGIASGASGAPGAGALTFTAVLPPIPGLRGTRFNLQGFVLDAGAPSGFATTAGLETWLQ